MIADQKEVNYIISDKKTVRSVWQNGNLMYFYGGPNKLTSPWTELSRGDDIKYFQRLKIWAQPSTSSWAAVEGDLPANTYGLMIDIYDYIWGPHFDIYKDSSKSECLLTVGPTMDDKDAADIYLAQNNDSIVNKIELSTPTSTRNKTYGVILYIYRTAPKSSNKLQVDVMEYMNGSTLSTKHYTFTDTQDVLRPGVGGYYSTTITYFGLNGYTNIYASAYYQLKGTQKTKLIFGNTGDIQTGGYYVYGDSFTPEGTDISNVKVTTTAHHASAIYNSSNNTISCTIYSSTSGLVDASVTYYSVP